MRISRIHPIILFLLACLLMALVYTQLPLYTSNQHQYFLHGMAQAEQGSLNEDWLANTIEPAPLFTLLVKWVFILLRSPVWFYLIYALILGLYLYWLVAILDRLFNFQSRVQWVLTVTLLLLAHSAALRYMLGNWLGAQWAFFLDGGLAGQRLLGTVLQPSVFGVLLLAACLCYLSDQPLWAAALAALGACIHPTYLFSAALLVKGFILHTWIFKRKPVRAIGMGALALLIVAPILVYTLTHFFNGEESEYARYILTHIRLPHHALASYWLDLPAIFKIGMIVAALAAVRRHASLFIPLLTVFTGALVLTVIQLATGDKFLALLFPWRPSALLVPLASSILIAKSAIKLEAFLCSSAWMKESLVEKACCTLLVLLCALGGIRMLVAFREDQQSPQREMLTWVRETSSDGDRYLIPINMEKFRTFTLRPVYVDFFAIPYNSADVVTWYHRVLSVNKFYDGADCNELYHISHNGGLNHVVIAKDFVVPECPGLRRVYQDEHYSVYFYEMP